jgi:hypothetical protein
VFEWRVAVVCPVRAVQALETAPTGGDHRRDLYVWTEQHSAVDAYDEALRVLAGWPEGSRPVDVVAVGMYVPSVAAGRSGGESVACQTTPSG